MDAGGDDRLGLTLNEAKTSIKEARQERFDFLGYTFGPHYYRKDGQLVSGGQSVEEERGRIKEKVAEICCTRAMWRRGRKCATG